MNLLQILFFLYSTTICYSQYIVNDNLMIHYDKLYSNNNRFNNALDQSYIIDTNYNNTDICMNQCAIEETCLGIYENYDTNYYCNILSNLGGPKYVDEISNSYVKIMHYTNQLENHSISGIIWDSSIFNDNLTPYNSTIYLDLNHNGILDSGEPYNTISNDNRFIFDNIIEGTYLVRQVVPDTCIQFFPGLNGSFIIGDNNIQGDSFIDNVIRYKHYGYSNYTYPIGRYVSNDTIIRDENFTAIIGNSSDTYMAFHIGDSIVLTLVDETILNSEGVDLYVDMLNNSNTYANISVSHNEHDYTYLGILNSSNELKNSFDLSDIDYELPVNYIKLDFFGNNTHNTLDIIRVGIYNNSIYLPPFAYNINVPKYESLIFLNDCHYDFDCSTYCDFNIYDDDHYNSCLYGCDLFEDTKNCNCYSNLIPNNYFEQNNLNNFHSDYCMKGCEYSVDKYVFPNYTLIPNYNGISNSKIFDFENCTTDCLDILLENCDKINNCRSLSLSENDFNANLFNNYNHRKANDTLFLLKNSYFDTTSTTTTTGTSSTTTTGTLTYTSTTTTTGTSSTTTTGTSSTTTTGTSTTTTTGTSSTTTTGTLTYTSSTTTNNNIIELSKDSKNVSNNIIIGVSTTGGILLIILIIILVINKKSKNRIENRAHFSATNPVYNENGENGDPSLYQDVDNSFTEGYITVMESES